jgi:hypothetical protein
MRRTGAEAAACATLALAAVVPAVAAAAPAGSARPAVVEERNYEVHAYGLIFGGLNDLTFQIRPEQGTWSLTVSSEGFEVPFFAGTYTTRGRVSTFTDSSFEFPACDFTLVSGPSATSYAGLSSCRITRISPFAIKGLFLLDET